MTNLKNTSNTITCMYFEKKYEQKPQGTECGIVQKSLKKTTITISNLAEGLCNGASFKPGVLIGGMGAKNWTEQQLFGLDFDNGMTISETYNKVISLNLIPVFMYTTFSHTEEHHKFRMIFCNDIIITDGTTRDKLQATLMGIVGGIDEKCFNRDRLFFGGKGHEVLYPAYDSRINAEEVIQKYWNDDFEKYISGNKKTVKKSQKKVPVQEKAAKPVENPGENLNVKAIKEHDAEYLRKKLNYEPIEFETKQEFWDHIYYELDIAELLGIEHPKSFCCVLHEEKNPSASIFRTKEGVWKYKCFSEDWTLNIKELIEYLGKYKSEYKSVEFIKQVYGLSVKESQWSIEQRENIDMMLSKITMNKFKELCPQADKNIKYAKDTFMMMLSIARNNIYSEKFSNDDGEIVFFVSNKRLAECMGKGNSQKKMDKIRGYVKMLIYHDLLRTLDDDKVPPELLAKAIKYSGSDKRAGKHVNFYAIPSWVIEQLRAIEDHGRNWKSNGYRTGGISYDMFYRKEGYEVAAKLYPQYKKQKNEDGEIVDRTPTAKSDERTLKIAEVILSEIENKGYCTEKEVVVVLGNQYKYAVTETQIKRCLGEILDTYDLQKVKTNKALKEQYHIDSEGYPYIIINNTDI